MNNNRKYHFVVAFLGWVVYLIPLLIPNILSFTKQLPTLVVGISLFVTGTIGILRDFRKSESFFHLLKIEQNNISYGKVDLACYLNLLNTVGIAIATVLLFYFDFYYLSIISGCILFISPVIFVYKLIIYFAFLNLQ